eukprot:5113957-Amphidinium_carterae.1
MDVQLNEVINDPQWSVAYKLGAGCMLALLGYLLDRYHRNDEERTYEETPPVWQQILAVVTFLLIFNIRNAHRQLVVGLVVLGALLIWPTRVTQPSVTKTKDIATQEGCKFDVMSRGAVCISVVCLAESLAEASPMDDALLESQGAPIVPAA